MTIIVAKEYEDRIEFAADSMGTWGNLKCNTGTKIYKYSEYIAGGVSSRWGLEIYLGGYLEGCREWISSNYPTVANQVVFNTNFIKYLEENKMSAEVCQELSYIICWKGVLFGANHSLMPILPGGFIAIGSGYEHAIAALTAGMSAQEAVRIACKYNLNCAEPITTLTIKKQISTTEK